MVRSLHPSEVLLLRAAQGWLELQDPQSARAEVAQIAPHHQTHPDVLEMRWKIHAQARQWRTCRRLATILIEDSPERLAGWICLSMALHGLHQTEEAWETLLDVVDVFPESPAIPYELARYSCLLGFFPEACRWLAQASAQGDAREVQLMALDDPDLQPLWRNLG